MTGLLYFLVIVVGLLLAAMVAVVVLRDWPISRPILLLAGVVETVLVVQGGIGVVLLAETDRAVAGALFLGYLLTSMLVLPAAVAWSQLERSRWASAVLMLGALVVVVLEVRLHQIWWGR